MGGTAVVTGANSGIGLATALRLAADGYEVFAGARRPETLDGIAVAASAEGVTGVHPIALDVDDDASVEAAFGPILGQGPVDVLVNNAGVAGVGSVEETDIARYRQVLETNVLGAIRCTQQVLPGMRDAHRGRIVNMSSASAISAPPMMSAYALSKFALEALSESLQAEVAPHGIRVIVLRPGTIKTPIWGKGDMPTDTAYPQACDLLLQIITYNLTHAAVDPSVVADVVGEAVAQEAPAFRHLVGDADVPARMRERYGDEELFGVFFLEGDAFRERYREMSGIDYWP